MRADPVSRAQKSTRKAIQHYLDAAYEEFYLQAAIALELLMKAFLAGIDKSFIVENHFDSMLIISGNSKYAKEPPWKIKTIGEIW